MVTFYSRMRLRKKTWRSPGTVYTDAQVFEKDIHVFANYEMFVEPLEGEGEEVGKVARHCVLM